MTTDPVLNAPLSMPITVGTYLIDAIDDTESPIGFSEPEVDKDEKDPVPGWRLVVAGIPLRTREIGRIDEFPDPDPSTTPLPRPRLSDMAEDRVIVLSQGSGYAQPKWGLDVNRFRLSILVGENAYPALIAEDMCERLKMSLNSMDEREVWRKKEIIFIEEVEVDPPEDPPRYEEKEIKFDYNIHKYVMMRMREDCPTPKDGNRIKDLHKLVRASNRGTVNKDDFEHVANWTSAILDGSTIIQEVTPFQGQGRYTSYSVDFITYVELVHDNVLGYRQKFVPQET